MEKPFDLYERRRSLNHVLNCLRLLSPRARVSYLVVTFFQCLTSVIDLLGLTLMINLILVMQSTSRSESGAIATIPLVSELLEKYDPNILFLFVVIVFLLKGLTALILHKVNLVILASETDLLVNRVTDAVFQKRAKETRSLTVQDTSYLIFNSTEIVFKDTLLPLSVILADSVLVFLVGLNLYLSAPALFVPSAMYFSTIFIVLLKLEGKKSRQAYKTQLENEIRSRSLIHQTADSLRELIVSNKLNYFTDKIVKARRKGIYAGADVAIAQLRPKYIYEMALFGGVGMMVITANLVGDQALALVYITMFVISSSRLIPSLLRIQFYLSTFRKSVEQSGRIFDVLNISMKENSDKKLDKDQVVTPPGIDSFTPGVELKNVSFSYSKDQKQDTISLTSLSISPGESVAFVGASGAGKSSLIDLILGYLEPDTGSVQISGLPPKEIFSRWPGKVSYVPQNVTIFEGSLISNIAIGAMSLSDESVRSRVASLLEQVGLAEFLKNLPDGLNSKISEFGSNLSGGQIQRIGIARALYPDPSIIVFDESTSSLDSVTESEIMDLLLGFRDEKTLIFVAHRLSTIKSLDRIFYLGKGKILGVGTFDELRKIIPDFNKQAELLDVN